MRNLSTAILIACTVATTSPAIAASNAETAKIAYGDLNLDSPRGVATFHGRLRVAADRVCGRPVTEPLQLANAVKECRASVTQEASEKVLGRKGSVTVIPSM